MCYSHSVKSQHNTVKCMYKSVEFIDNNDWLGVHFTNNTVNSNVHSAIQTRYTVDDFKYTPCNIVISDI